MISVNLKIFQFYTQTKISFSIISCILYCEMYQLYRFVMDYYILYIIL